MRNAGLIRILVASLGLALWAGCKSTPARNGRTAGESVADDLRFAGRDEEVASRARAHGHYAAGIIHELNAEHALALDEFFKAAQANPDDETLLAEVTRRLLQAKQPAKAVELLRPASKRPDASGMVFARLGIAYSQLGETEKAFEANRLAIKKSPDTLAGYQNLFLNYLQAQQPEAALKVLDDAARRSGASPEFLIGVGELYATYALQSPTQREELHAKGIKVLNRIKDSRVQSSLLKLKLADGYNLFGDTERAAELYEQLLKRKEDVPGLHDDVRAKLANVYLRDNDRKRAAEQLEAIVKRDPSNAQAYYLLGRIAYDEERWADAADHLKKAVLFSPGFQEAYYQLAVAQISQGKTSEALATLATARAKFSSNFLTEYLEATAHSRNENYAAAVEHFTRAEVIAQATETKRLDFRFYFQIGAACERKGDLEQAARYFEKCLELSPDYDEALNYLGYMWADAGVNLEKARDLIERAVKADPTNAAYLDSMGWVLFKLNQPKEALEYMLKAVEHMEESDATLYDHLGDIYEALNEIAKAKEAWSKSLAVEPNEKIRKKLDAVQSQ